MGNDNDLLISQLNDEILDFIRTEIPADSDPINNWYHRYYLGRGQGYGPYCSSVMEFLEPQRDRFDRITEIGAGIGQNCIHFAANGWDTVAVESGRHQYELMERLLDRVANIAPEVRSRINSYYINYPERAEEYLNLRTVAATFTLCTSDAPDQPMILPLQLAGGVIMEPRVFFRPRSPDEQTTLIKDVENLGFEPPIPFWDSSGAPDFFALRLSFFPRRH